MIDKFIKFKEPNVIEDDGERKGGIIFRSIARLTDGKYVLISDAQHGSGIFSIDETLVFSCDESGSVTDWAEIAGGRFMRTEEVINSLNDSD